MCDSGAALNAEDGEVDGSFAEDWRKMPFVERNLGPSWCLEHRKLLKPETFEKVTDETR